MVEAAAALEDDVDDEAWLLVVCRDEVVTGAALEGEYGAGVAEVLFGVILKLDGEFWDELAVLDCVSADEDVMAGLEEVVDWITGLASEELLGAMLLESDVYAAGEGTLDGLPLLLEELEAASLEDDEDVVTAAVLEELCAPERVVVVTGTLDDVVKGSKLDVLDGDVVSVYVIV